MIERTLVEEQQCRCCDRLAVACDECRRALGVFAAYPADEARQIGLPSGLDWISHHPESGTDCRLCLRGPAELCLEHLFDHALKHHAHTSNRRTQ